MTAQPPLPLAGWTIGITAERRRAELGAALERHGARVQYGQAISIVPLDSDTVARAATEQCVQAPLDFVLATTGVGFRGWLDASQTWALGGPLHDALERAAVITRGPKARGAVRAAGLRETWSPESESSAEVLQYLLAGPPLSGRRIAVQLHGDPMTDVLDALRAAGADVIEVPVYRWLPPADPVPLQKLITATVDGGVHCVTFTSAPAATNFLRTADQSGVGDPVRVALRDRVLCAAVGAVTAAPLVDAGIPSVQPDRARLGALVREVTDQLPRHAVVVSIADRRVELRGHAVMCDGVVHDVAAETMATLRRGSAPPEFEAWLAGAG